MSRKNRKDTVSDNSAHHVVQRGINRIKIFKELEDYEYVKHLLRRYLRPHGIQIYNYCLMPNHIHILLNVKEGASLAKFMQALSLAYSSYYRYKYKYSGYLWQGRYKNFCIDKDSCLLECARYIERNPIRVKHIIVKDLSLYQWSSYNFYSKNLSDDIITVNPLFNTFGVTPEERQLKYNEYILTPRPYEEVLDDVLRI